MTLFTIEVRTKNSRNAQSANAAALKTLVGLLQRHFRENAPAERTDEAVYNLIVAPALELPIDSTDPGVREALATMTIAKARFLRAFYFSLSLAD